MKRLPYALLILAMLTTIILYQVVTIKAQEAEAVEVAEAVVCKDVVDREPIDVGDSFEVTVGKLFCFTKIVGAQEEIEIAHVWYYGDVERARVNLSVRAASWRTWSSKIIQEHEIGDWHVDIIGPDDEVLETVEFEITP
ncbi:MAG: DUF2914 domain-containing protein [Candidatus Aminicenantes bacterium]|nr:DUF2914 domain-containing protein [Candidatus Aminicenantes bacterium]